MQYQNIRTAYHVLVDMYQRTACFPCVLGLMYHGLSGDVIHRHEDINPIYQ